MLWWWCFTTRVTDEPAAISEADTVEADGLVRGTGTPVEAQVAPQQMSALAVGFDPAVGDRLRARADTEGVGVTQLVRAWVLDRLEADDAVPVEADEALSTLRRLVARRSSVAGLR